MAGYHRLKVGHSEALDKAVFSVKVGADVGASRGNDPDRLGVVARLNVANMDDATVAVSGDSAVGSLQAISVFCCCGPSV